MQTCHERNECCWFLHVAVVDVTNQGGWILTALQTASVHVGSCQHAVFVLVSTVKNTPISSSRMAAVSLAEIKAIN